ncbi:MULTISPECIES: PD-(D/E)XK nuclease family protein [unclassified Leptolyngbya]|uniref:PD-(D/E)XK nuclease family protein n=1 Tax=unclassified Leptolyngbya TaxID=2650499 RepID=UPI0018F02F11
MARSASKARSTRGYFIDEMGVRLPSVTTVLNATKPPEAREALAKWRDRLGSEEASRVSIAASRRGTLTHTQLRHYLLGNPIPCPDLIRPYWESLQPVLTDIQEVHLVETTVFHHDLGYAGKVDCVVNYQGTPCLLDWKTGDRPKGSIERLYDAPLQVAAYCGAVNHSRQVEGVEVRSARVVVALPDQPAEVFSFDLADVLSYWEQWEERLAKFYRRR